MAKQNQCKTKEDRTIYGEKIEVYGNPMFGIRHYYVYPIERIMTPKEMFESNQPSYCRLNKRKGFKNGR